MEEGGDVVREVAAGVSAAEVVCPAFDEVRCSPEMNVRQSALCGASVGPKGQGAAVQEVTPGDCSSVVDPGIEATDVLESTLT